MSEINGQEIMKRRAPMNSMIKAVLFDLDDTLYCEYDYVDQAFSSGCDAYASKPINMEKVQEVMQQLGLVPVSHE